MIKFSNLTEMIVINARFLTQKISGVQRFAIEICRRLKIEYGDNVKFVSPANIINKCLAKDLDVILCGKNTGYLWEQYDLIQYLKNNGCPFLLNLTNTAPIFYKKNIVTLHDVAFKKNPSWFNFKFSAWYNVMIPSILEKATLIFTVSEFSKKEILKYFNVSKYKIFVIPNAVSFEEMNTRNQAKENFILAVSSLDPRKNFKKLIEAFNKMNSDTHLKIVGSENKVFSDQGLKEIIKSNSRIELTGYVTDQELINLYQSAKLFVYPSLYEGFGIPPLEAMYFGCPTLVSNLESLRETCSDASLYFDPDDIDDLSSKLVKLSNDHELQNNLIAKGFSQIKKFSWKKSVSLLITQLEKL